MKCRFILLAAAVILALQPLVAPATTVRAPSFDSLVNQADYVVRAVVKSVSSEFQTSGTNRHIITKVALSVSEVVKGTPPQPLVLEMLGGKVGDVVMTVDGAPQFLVGDEDILFIHGNGEQISPLVAIMYGRYPIYRDATSGEDYVVRSNGMPLYSEQDVSLPLTKLSTAKEANSGARPMTAAAFIGKIRAAAGANSSNVRQN
jgi:hypothetical protein